MVRLNQVAIIIDLGGQVIRTRSKPSVRKDMINSTINLLCFLEKSNEVSPYRDVSLDKSKGTLVLLLWRLDVTADD